MTLLHIKMEEMAENISNVFQWPLFDLSPGEHLAIADVWRHGDFTWLRMTHPRKEIVRDYCIRWIMNCGGDLCVLVELGSIWRHYGERPKYILVKIVSNKIISIFDDAEFSNLLPYFMEGVKKRAGKIASEVIAYEVEQLVGKIRTWGTSPHRDQDIRCLGIGRLGSYVGPILVEARRLFHVVGCHDLFHGLQLGLSGDAAKEHCRLSVHWFLRCNSHSFVLFCHPPDETELFDPLPLLVLRVAGPMLLAGPTQAELEEVAYCLVDEMGRDCHWQEKEVLTAVGMSD